MAKSKSRERTARMRAAKSPAAASQISAVAFGEALKKPLVSEKERVRRLALVRGAQNVGLGEPPSRPRPVASAAKRGIVGKLKKVLPGSQALSRSG